MGRVVKPTALLTVGAIVLAVGASVAWSTIRSEREFRRLLREGEHALGEGRTLEAIEAYSGALALRPDSMVAHLKRGDSYRQRGDLETALRDLRDAAALDPAAPRPLELLADVNVALGRTDRAIELYRQCLGLDERAPRVLYKLGLAYYRTHRAADAIDTARRALALDDRLSEAHYLLGVSLQEEHRSAEAVRALRRAVALSPGLIGAREALADVYAAAGRRREELEQLEAIAALEPDRPERVVSIAAAYTRSGRNNAAIGALERLGDDLPNDPMVRTEVARTWLAAAVARRDSALARRAREILDSLAAQPDASGDVLALLGQAQLRGGELTAAERTLQRAVARVPVSAGAFLDLADAAERLRHLATARSALIDFAALTADDDARGRAVTRIAALSLSMTDAATAAEWMRKAVREGRPTVETWQLLATAEYQLGRRAAARDAVQHGLQLNPRQPALLRLRRQLR